MTVVVNAQADARDGDTLTDGMGEVGHATPVAAMTDAPKGWQCVNKLEISTGHHNEPVIRWQRRETPDRVTGNQPTAGLRGRLVPL